MVLNLTTALAKAEPTEVLQNFDEILRALEFAHELGIVHRDLKPKNIFCSRVGPAATQSRLWLRIPA